MRFGNQNPVATLVNSSQQLQAASPPNATSEPVNVTAYFSNGTLALAPLAFSYGPKIERILPNTGVQGGSDAILILGYGFDTSGGSLTVTMGGQTANVQKVENFPSFAAALALDASYPFPLQRITVTTPSGSPGKVDVVVTSSAGSAAAAKSFQYLSASQTYPVAGLHKFILYDQSRQKLLTATDHIDSFNLATQSFGAPFSPFPNGPPADAALRGLALTPDQSQLIVADFGGQSICLVRPDQPANSVRVPVRGVAGFLNSGPARITATNDSTVFVGMSGEGGSSGPCSGCLGQLNISTGTPQYEPAPQPEVSAVKTGAPLLPADAAGDTVYLSFGNSASGGPLASWSAAAPNAFTVSTSDQQSAKDLTSAADGNVFAVRTNTSMELRDARLSLFAAPASAKLENVPGRTEVPGAILHPSGPLLYQPFLDGPAPALPPATELHGGVDICDAHNGQLRLRVYLPDPFAMLSTDIDGLRGGFLAIDENGQQLFAVSTAGLTIVKLATVPLGIGSLTPAAGTALGGTTVTLRGSGFQSGTKVTIGGKAASTTFKEMNMLTFITPAMKKGAQRLALTIPTAKPFFSMRRSSPNSSA